MAVRVFAVQNVADNADLARQAISSLLRNGGGLVQAGDLTVSQTSTPSMTVNVSVGRAWIDGTNLSHISGQGYGNQGQYFLINDSTASVTLATANGTNPRIDVIYAACPDTYYSGASNTPVITVATGTPAAGASWPANSPAFPANCLPLAWIYVGAGVPSVNNGNITALATTIVGPSQLPYEMRAGETPVTVLSTNAGGTANVTFPQPFTVAPIVTCTIATSVGSGASKLQAHAYNVTNTGFTIQLQTMDNSAVGTTYAPNVFWQAVQMTPTSAAG